MGTEFRMLLAYMSKQGLFFTYNKIDSGYDLINNNMTYKAVRVESNQIRMNNGIIKTLIEAWHIPDLEKSLISFGIFDSKGYQWVIEGGGLWISNAALVIMKCAKGRSLYILQGNMVIGSATLSSTKHQRKDDQALAYKSSSYEWKKHNTQQAGIQTIELRFYENCIFDKQRRI